MILEKLSKLLRFIHPEKEEKRLLIEFFLRIGIESAFLTLLIFLWKRSFWYLAVYPLIFVAIVFFRIEVLEIKRRTKIKEVERVLPDALEIIASNLRAGMTLEQALLYSIRPDLGEFAKEMKIVTKEIYLGEKITDALTKMAARVGSTKLSEVIWLINKGIEGGGNIADLLTENAKELRDIQYLEDETKANVSMYKSLITGAVLFGAPILIGIAVVIAEIINTVMSEEIGNSNESIRIPGAITLEFSNTSIDNSAINYSGLAMVIIITIFSSVTISIISYGYSKPGIKNIPLMLTVTLTLYFLITKVLKAKLLGILK